MVIQLTTPRRRKMARIVLHRCEDADVDFGDPARSSAGTGASLGMSIGIVVKRADSKIERTSHRAFEARNYLSR